MPLNEVIYTAADGRAHKTLEGLPLFPKGAHYIAYAFSGTVDTTTSEESLFTDTVPSEVDFTGYPINEPTKSIRLLPASAFIQGTVYRGKIRGTITNTSTPSLTSRFGLVSEGGTFTVLATTGAVAMTAITGTGDFEIGYEFSVRTVGSVGVIVANVYHRYNSTVVYAPTTTTSALDLSKPYYLDLRVTWGASSASNLIAPEYGYLEVVA